MGQQVARFRPEGRFWLNRRVTRAAEVTSGRRRKVELSGEGKAGSKSCMLSLGKQLVHQRRSTDGGEVDTRAASDMTEAPPTDDRPHLGEMLGAESSVWLTTWPATAQDLKKPKRKKREIKPERVQRGRRERLKPARARKVEGSCCSSGRSNCWELRCRPEGGMSRAIAAERGNGLQGKLKLIYILNPLKMELVLEQPTRAKERLWRWPS